MATLLSIEGLEFSFDGQKNALREISFEVAEQDLVFFHGANGAGKSTLFQCLTGLLNPQKGTILYKGQALKKGKDRMDHMQMVFQNPQDQLIASSVYEEVAFGPLNQGLRDEEVHRRVQEALDLFHLNQWVNRPPHLLSFGQKKRVTMASAIAMAPEILLLDEPTAGLDEGQQRDLIEILKNLNQRGTTLLIATHDMDFSYDLAKRVVLLDQGSIVGQGSALSVFQDEELLTKSHFSPPLVLEVYENLVKMGWVKKGNRPKNRQELRTLFQELQRSQGTK